MTVQANEVAACRGRGDSGRARSSSSCCTLPTTAEEIQVDDGGGPGMSDNKRMSTTEVAEQ